MEKFAQTIENFPHTVNQAILFQERAEAFQLREAPLLSEEDYQALRETILSVGTRGKAKLKRGAGGRYRSSFA